MFENIWETCFLMMKMGTVVYLDLMHIYRPAAIKSMKQKRTFSTCLANVSEKVLFSKIIKHKKKNCIQRCISSVGISGLDATDQLCLSNPKYAEKDRFTTTD